MMMMGPFPWLSQRFRYINDESLGNKMRVAMDDDDDDDESFHLALHRDNRCMHRWVLGIVL